jgi:hypothetical protein
MKKRSRVKKILYILGSTVIILLLAVWVFLSFFFQGTLNKVVIPKIQHAVFGATHGRFVLTLDKISYTNGTLICNTFILSRAAYDSSERGMVLERLTIDSARFEGLSWWNVLWGEELDMTALRLDAPKLYMSNVDPNRVLQYNTHYDTAKKSISSLSNLQVITLDSIILNNISVFLPKPPGKAIEPTYRNITITLTDFLLDAKSIEPQPLLFSKRVDFSLPGGSYSLNDSLYSLAVGGIHGSFSDSLVRIDSITLRPNYSKLGFADMYKYIQGSLELRCSRINIRGINFLKLLKGEGVSVTAFEASSWYLEYYADKRKQKNPNPPDVVFPHTLVNSIKVPITVDTIILNNGMIRLRERIPGSTQTGLITFTDARVMAHPFCTDTSVPLYSKPLSVSVNALFMGQGKTIGTVIYQIHHKAFDLQIRATVGGFGLPLLNSYFVSNERKELAGTCFGGELSMDIRSATATTTISPRYTDLKIKVLAAEVEDSRGILEVVKTFIGNSFVLRTNNIDTEHKKAVSATTAYVWSGKEEFFEFIWFAMRRSLGKVVGF